MPSTPHQDKPQQWQKSWLTHIPHEIRTEIYGHCFTDGFLVHCNTIKDNGHCHCVETSTPNVNSEAPRGEVAEARGYTTVNVERGVRRESVLSRLLRTCWTVNKEVSQHCLILLLRRHSNGFLHPASCINNAIWWTYIDLRLVDPGSKFIPKFAPLWDQEVETDVPEWRIELIESLAREFVRARGTYGSGITPVSQRVHLYDFSGHCYGSVRQRDYRDMSSPSRIFVIEISVFPRLGQWFGIADLVKCVVAVEIVLQLLKLGRPRDYLGAGTRDMCRMYSRPGVADWETLVVFEAERWEVAAWKEKDIVQKGW